MISNTNDECRYADFNGGITGEWIVYNSGRCSVCRTSEGRMLRLAFGDELIRFCEPCGVAMRELLIDALKD